ncbi:hypothetical protein ACFTSF_29005 [Kribbella sp. NPDC056951]
MGAVRTVRRNCVNVRPGDGRGHPKDANNGERDEPGHDEAREQL